MIFFFFNDTATTEIYTLSLHDALPIYVRFAAQPAYVWMAPHDAGGGARRIQQDGVERLTVPPLRRLRADRKSTRLNSSHANISYAVFCLKKKKNIAVLFLYHI